MQLNGICKEKFLEWLDEESTWFQTFSDTHQNALIIEFFDSVGVYIYFNTGTYISKPNFRYEIITHDNVFIGFKENSRQEATIQAIKKANEIYNERFK